VINLRGTFAARRLWSTLDEKSTAVQYNDVSHIVYSKVNPERGLAMESTTTNETKALLKEVLLELLQERRSEFSQMILEAIEEIGLANAIRQGRQDEFVSEEEIQSILGG
jgi:ABC-type phosphate/phosphonate transport system substrate-binding protein